MQTHPVSWPKISVITVCLNAEDNIEKAILSVLNQNYKNMEYIIVDGKSTDKTLEIIEKYQKSLAKIISEKDLGIYDAMNKGLREAKGDIVYFLNSDDRFFDRQVVHDIAAEFADDPRLGLVYGKVSLQNLAIKLPFRYTDPFVPEIKTLWDFLKKGMCQQRVFAKMKLFRRYGLLDSRYRICADFKWFLNNLQRNVPMKFIDRNIVYYNYQGFSNQNANLLIREKVEIILKNCSLFHFLYYVFFAIARKFRVDFSKD